MFCSNCGTETDGKFCPNCGAAIGAVQSTDQPTQASQPIQASQPVQQPLPNYQQPTIVINNVNNNRNVNTNNNAGYAAGRPKNKWVAFFLCLFLGFFGAHKFYEGKVGMGILYLFTAGLFCIGWIVDLIVLLFKPNPYYV